MMIVSPTSIWTQTELEAKCTFIAESAVNVWVSVNINS